ncbi:MAG TPA: Ig-like domain-containing protein [Anaerolineales bacterium]|nr:Ig-like domain-containing protein [Anaerolineales bacterium]
MRIRRFIHLLLCASMAAGFFGALPSLRASASADAEGWLRAQNISTTIAKASGQNDPTNVASIKFVVTFGVAIKKTTFTISDVSLSGSTAPGATVSDITEIAPNDKTTFRVTVTGMTGSGSVLVSIGAGAVQDASGNTNLASNTSSVTYDIDSPNVTVEQASGQNDPTNAASIKFVVTFSEPIKKSTFDLSDVSLGGTAPGATVSDITEIAPNDKTTFRITVSGMTSSGTVIASIGAGLVTDPAGNSNYASTSFDNSVTYDIDSPSVTVEQLPAQDDPTNATPIKFLVTFSEPIKKSTFDLSDVSLGGTAPGATVSDITEIAPNDKTTFRITVSGMTGSGTVIASIGAGLVTDLAGNGNNASTSFDNSVTYDIDSPSVTINQTPAQDDPTNATPIKFLVTFSEPIKKSTFDLSDISLGGTAPGAYVSDINEVAPNDKTTFHVLVSGMTGSGTVTASIGAGLVTDLVGNGNNASTSFDNTVTYDIDSPSATINQTPAQNDPTNATPIKFVLKFSEPIKKSTLDLSDISLGGTAPGAYVSDINEVAPNDKTTFHVLVTGVTGPGTVTAILGANLVEDQAGNLNLASTSTDDTVTFDNVQPTVSITSTTTNPTNVSPIPLTITFNKAVTGFDVTDLAVGNGTAGNFAGSGATYTVDITPTANGAVTVDVAQGVAQDTSGNDNTAAVQFSTTYDTTPIAVMGGGVAGNPGALAVLDGGTYSTHFTSIVVTFSKDAYNPGDPTDPEAVTNPHNYLLVQPGDLSYETTGCNTGVAGNDVQIPTGPVTYNNHLGMGPFEATVTVNGGVPLPAGAYRLFVCGSTSITDLAGNHLGGGADTVLTFNIQDPTVPGNTTGAAGIIPVTGFAPDRLTILPPQTTSYTSLGNLWLEIPKLGVQMPIVGVPQSKDGTWDVSWLGQAAGWLNGTAFPTWAGNSVLTGHVYDAYGQPGPFRYLNTLWWGDRVIVHAGGVQYVYEVRSVSQVGPGSTAAMLKHEDLPWITLVTCRGYDEASNSYKYRVLVRAVLVSVK